MLSVAGGGRLCGPDLVGSGIKGGVGIGAMDGDEKGVGGGWEKQTEVV